MLGSISNKYTPNLPRLTYDRITFNELLSGSEIRDDDLMLDPIDQDVLRLDVPMRNRQHKQIVQSSENLIGVNLDQYWIDLPLLDDLVEVIGVVIHNDIEVLVVSLVGEKAILHDEIIGMVEHLQNLMLTILIFFILEYLLYCYFLTSGTIHPEIHHPKRSLACNSFYFILGGDDFGLGIGGDGGIDLGSFVGFSLHVFIDAGGFILVYFEVLPLRVGVLRNVFRVDIDEFRF